MKFSFFFKIVLFSFSNQIFIPVHVNKKNEEEEEKMLVENKKYFNLSTAYFAWNIFISVDSFFLKKDMEWTFILRERMTSDSTRNRNSPIVCFFTLSLSRQIYLLINSSSPLRLSSIKSSSNIPSLLRRKLGICRSHAFPGNGGTTICQNKSKVNF